VSRARIRNALLFAVSLGLVAFALSSEARGIEWLRRGTYPTVFVAVGLWLVRAGRWARPRWPGLREALRLNAAELWLAAGATALVFLGHDRSFKVLADETNFIALGRSLASDWRFDLPDATRWAPADPQAYSWIFDKRPPLFPFAIGLVDIVAGYRVANAWLLNGLVLGATALLAAVVLRRRVGRPWNLLAVLWALANPVVFFTARGATAEPLLGLLWAIAAVALVDVLEEPTEEGVGLLLATATLLGLCRLEAGPLAGLMLVAVLVASSERRRFLRLVASDPAIFCLPALALPVVLQRLRLGSYFEGLEDKPFALSYLASNAKNWLAILADGGRKFPFSTPVLVIEALAVIVLLVRTLSGEGTRSRAERATVLIVTAGASAVFLLYSVYFWGQPTVPVCMRFYAMPLFLAGLTVPTLFVTIPALRERPVGIAVVSALLFVSTLPSSKAPPYPARVRHDFVASYVAARAPARIQLVTQLPSESVIYDVAAMDFATFERTRAQLKRDLERRLVDEVVLVQEINFDETPRIGDAPPPNVTLERLVERQDFGTRFVRLSRMKW
jgi:hypothetical protein